MGNASISAYLTILPLHRVTRPPTVTRPTFKSFTRVGFCLHLSQPARAVSDSEWVTAFPTRYPPSVSTDRPGTGSDRIWVRSFANTAHDGIFDPDGDPLFDLCPRDGGTKVFVTNQLCIVDFPNIEERFGDTVLGGELCSVDIDRPPIIETRIVIGNFVDIRFE